MNHLKKFNENETPERVSDLGIYQGESDIEAEYDIKIRDVYKELQYRLEMISAECISKYGQRGLLAIHRLQEYYSKEK